MSSNEARRAVDGQTQAGALQLRLVRAGPHRTCAAGARPQRARPPLIALLLSEAEITRAVLVGGQRQSRGPYARVE